MQTGIRAGRAAASFIALIGTTLACAALSGCTDFIDRRADVSFTDELISVESDPPGAACGISRNGLLLDTLITPGSINIATGPEDIVLVCKKQDYEVAAAVLHSDTNQAPVVLGVLAGWAVDLVQQPHYSYEPDTHVTLIASREPSNSSYSQTTPTSDLTAPGAGPAPPRTMPPMPAQ
jgi:hypothetical protein